MTLATGTTLLNRYRIVKLVGQGGFGAVYRGWDTALSRAVAVKENIDTGPESQRQFEREAKLLANLRHANLPTVFDHFVLPDGQFLIMEYVEGKSLHEMLIERGGPLEEADVVEWARQVCDALTYLHTHTPPIIHRDIKPENIIITADDRAVLVDFGISKLYDPGKGTTVGAKAITPGYSPLEQYGRGRTDARSDVYSLGATLYSLLTDKLPPEAPDLSSGADVLMPPREVNPAVSEKASAAVVAAMTPAISQRLVSAAALSHMLLTGGASTSPPVAVPAPLGAAASSSGKVRRWKLLSLLGWVSGAVALLSLAIWAVLMFRGENGESVQETVEATAARTVVATATQQPATPDVVFRSGVRVERLIVPAGSFRMGSEMFGQLNEQPIRVIELPGFWIDRTEVTNQQYRRCIGQSKCVQPAKSSVGGMINYFHNPAYNLFPVIGVTWDDANNFCRWADGRLPTEAEWEYVGRGRNVVHWPWGNSWPQASTESANLKWKDATFRVNHPIRVGQRALDESWIGAMDMAGNVREWVNDWYRYYEEGWPEGPESGTARVVRGGSWHNSERDSHLSARGALPPDASRNYVGFRCAGDVVTD